MCFFVISDERIRDSTQHVGVGFDEYNKSDPRILMVSRQKNHFKILFSSTTKLIQVILIPLDN